MPNAPHDSSLSRPVFLGLAIVLIFIWGSAFTMVGVGVDYISPIWLVALRLIIGAVLLTIYMLAKGRRFPKLSDPRWLWYGVLGLTGAAIPFNLISTGQETVDSGISAILVGSMPIMTIILAHFFTLEKLTPQKVLGFIIGFSGIVLLFLPDNLSFDLIRDWRAQTLIIIGAFCYAVTTVIAKRTPETDSAIGAAMMITVAAIFGTGAAMFTGLPDTTPHVMGWVMGFGLGLGATGIATIIYLYIIEKSGPSAIARINYFVPVMSVFLGVTLLGEPFSWKMVISFATILAGVIISRQQPIAAPGVIKPKIR